MECCFASALFIFVHKIFLASFRYNEFPFFSHSVGLMCKARTTIWRNKLAFSKTLLKIACGLDCNLHIDSQNTCWIRYFFINIGSSNYMYNYLLPDKYNSSQQHNGEEFAALITTKLGNQLVVIIKSRCLDCSCHRLNLKN